MNLIRNLLAFVTHYHNITHCIICAVVWTWVAAAFEYTKNYLCNTQTHEYMSIEHALNGIWIFLVVVYGQMPSIPTKVQ